MTTATRYDFIIFIAIFYLGGMAMGLAQCPDPAFEIVDSFCLNERIRLTNTSDQSSDFIWDFCEGDLHLTPSATSILKLQNAINLTGVDYIVDDLGNYHSFVLGFTSNNLIRLDFGNDPRSSPEVVNLGNPGNLLSSPVNIKVINEEGDWYGVIYNSGNDNLVRLSFGGDLKNSSPTATNIIKANSTGFVGDLDIGYSKDKVVLVITNPNTNKITIINFKNSIANNPSVDSDVIITNAISGASSLRGITLFRICDLWFGFVVASNSRKIYRMEFGTDLFSNPSIFDITGSFTGTENFHSIWVDYDAGEYIGFVLTTQGVIYRLNFGDDITSIPEKESLNNLGVISGNSLSFHFLKVNSSWQGLIANSSLRDIYRIDFPANCSSIVSSYKGYNPPLVSYDNPGNYQVTLQIVNQSGHVNYLTKSIEVQNVSAPSINFNHDGLCVMGDVQFSLSSDLQANSSFWSFGDSQTSTDPSPTHQYSSSGDYNVSLTVTAENGCNNYVEKTISIFEEPIADFSLPAANPFCTNQDYVFENTSFTDEGSPVVWQWYVNGEEVSTGDNLEYSFSNTTSQEIKLTASIPGCLSEIMRSIAGLEAGPTVDFSFEGHCQSEQVTFTNQTVGDVTSYQWSFEDNTSSEVNPSYTFSTPGQFNVTLSATNAVGCNNSSVKTINIYTKPLADFAVNPPPSSCVGTPTPFIDLTAHPPDGDINSWMWNFGSDEGSSTQRFPEYVYASAGDYSVSLKVSTVFGCEDQIEKTITITESPVADFNYTTACVDLPVTFTNLSQNIKSVHWQIDGKNFFVSNPTYSFKNAGQQVVKLNATGNNNCIGTVTKTVTVPVPLSPDFSVAKNCINQNTVFTNTTAGDDPVVSVVWDFAGAGTSNLNPSEFSFSSTGNKSINLTVTAHSGCSYNGSKNVNIISPPKADFTATPTSGVPPLDVQFTNKSVGAISFVWTFHDGSGSISNVVSPNYTFNDLGQFAVELQAFNSQGCEDKISKVIETVLPLPDVELKVITLAENSDGSHRVILTLHNKGNTIVRNLLLQVDVSGNVSLLESVEGPIAPFSMFNYVLGFHIAKSTNIKFLCAAANLEGDLTPEDNLLCTQIQKDIYLYTPYPNPVKDELKIEWIAGKDQPLHIVLLDAVGKTMVDKMFVSSEGLNQQIFDVQSLRDGVYLLIIDDGITQKKQRIFIAGKN